MKHQRFITKLLYWSIVFYCLSIGSTILALVIQYTVAIFQYTVLFSILSVLIFFLLSSAFVFSLCNVLCFILLKTTIKHVLYALIWVGLSVLTGGAFVFSLIQAVLAQEYT